MKETQEQSPQPIIIQSPSPMVRSRSFPLDKIIKAASRENKSIHLYYTSRQPGQRLPITALPYLVSFAITIGAVVAFIIAVILVSSYLTLSTNTLYEFFQSPHPFIYTMIAITFLLASMGAGVGFLRFWADYHANHEHFEFRMDDEKQSLDIIEQSQTTQITPTWQSIPFNLDTHPHYLVAGETGSGKSNAVRALLTRLWQQNPQAELLIAELGGVEWPLATATNAEEIALISGVVRQIMMTRQGELKTAVRTHKTRPQFVPLIVLIEELNSCLALLKLQNPELHRQLLIDLTTISSMARKTAVHLIVTAQTGLSTGNSGIPSAIRANLTKIVGRIPRSVRTALDVPSDFDLENTNTGEFYVQTINEIIPIPLTRRIPKSLKTLTGEDLEGFLTPDTEMVQKPFRDGSQHGTESSNGIPTPVVSAPTSGRPRLISDEDEERIRVLLEMGWSANRIAGELGGGRSERLAQIRAVREEIKTNS